MEDGLKGLVRHGVFQFLRCATKELIQIAHTATKAGFHAERPQTLVASNTLAGANDARTSKGLVGQVRV